jgi:putative transposase
MCGGHRHLALENLALRQQLAVYKRAETRPRLRTTDRLFWVGLARVWNRWRDALLIVTPDTVLRWQRRRFRDYWTQLSARPAVGRPSVSAEIQDLVRRRMAAANPLWGAPRIHGELVKLGLDVSERTVSRLMPKRRRGPSQTWRTFLANHVRDLVSLDFFTVPTSPGDSRGPTCWSCCRRRGRRDGLRCPSPILRPRRTYDACSSSAARLRTNVRAGTARLRVLFVLVVLAHHRRRVVHFNVTEHPTAHWTAQQIVDAFPDESAPSYLLRERDRVYGEQFRRRVQGMGIEELLTPPQSPWQNPFAERLIGSCDANASTMSSCSASGT